MFSLPRRLRSGIIGGVAVVAALLVAQSALSTAAPASPAIANSITISASDAIARPWLGFGLNYEPQPGGGSNPGSYTDAQAALDAQRMDAIDPQIVRVTWLTTGFDPTNTVGSYDWTTPWAVNSFKGLDYLKSREIPVMTGWWSTPWDATGADHATVVADFLDYLINVKGYTNIKYWNGINEANHRDPTTYARWKTEVSNITAALAARDLPVTVIGPGTQDTGPTTDWLTAASSEMSGDLAGYANHLYPTGATSISGGTVAPALLSLISTIDANDPSKKPFFVEELGNKYGYDSATDAQPNVVNYGYGLDMADLAMQTARAGASSPMAWRLDDLGSPKVWGMYNGAGTDTALRPWAYSWTLLSSTMPAGAQLFKPLQPSSMRVLAAKMADGTSADWSIALVNRTSTASQSTVSIPGQGAATFDQYVYFDGARVTDAQGFPAPSGSVSGDLGAGITVTVPANSMILLSTLATTSVPPATEGSR
ncbi:hypothetical protein ACEXQE_02795 [Herbiconiux sp. P17]|uniref:hypothetical protein n=1 Tax=Herbiconiux wuyangfengii TaxID=3342794 RepID=UPI0035B95527